MELYYHGKLIKKTLFPCHNKTVNTLVNYEVLIGLVSLNKPLIPKRVKARAHDASLRATLQMMDTR